MHSMPMTPYVHQAAAKSREPPHDRMNMKEFMMACKLVTNFKNNPEATEATAAEKAEKVRQAAAQVAKSKQARLERTREQDDADHVAALKVAAHTEVAEKLAAERAQADKERAEKTQAEKSAREKVAAEMELALQKAREEAAEAAAELDAAQALGEKMKADGGAVNINCVSDYFPPEEDDGAGEDDYVDVSTIVHEGMDDLGADNDEETKRLRRIKKKKKEKEYGEGMVEVWSKPPVVNGRCTECHSKEAWCMCTKKRGFQADIQGVALDGLEGLISTVERSDGEDSDDPESDEDPVSPDWQLQQRLGIGSAGDESNSGDSDRGDDDDGGYDGPAPSFKTPEASPAHTVNGDEDGASSDDPEDSDDAEDAKDPAAAAAVKSAVDSKSSTRRVLMLDDGTALGDSSTDTGVGTAVASFDAITDSDNGILGLLHEIAGVNAADSSSDDVTGAVAAAAAAAFKAPLSVRDIEINAASVAAAAGNPLWSRSQSASADNLFGQYADRFFNKVAACDPDLSSTTPKGALLSYTRGRIISASLKRLDSGKKVSTLAIQMYSDLVKHVRGEMLPAESIPFIRTAVTYCLSSEDFRGEIVCHLVRQSNGNPSIEQQLRCWHLMCVFCSSFPAGEGLAEPLKIYATDRRRCAAAASGAAAKEASDPTPLLKAGASSLTDPAEVVNQQQELCTNLGKLEQYAACTIQALEKVAECGPRKRAPGLCIIEALRTQEPVLRRFYFITGDSAAVSIEPFATVVEVAETVARTVGLDSAQGWALFETTPQAEHWIKNTEYIADVLTEWEEAVKPAISSSKGKKGGGGGGGGGGSNPRDRNAKDAEKLKKSKVGAKFVFRKRLFLPGERLSMDDEATARLLYAQAVHSATRADEYGVSTETALQLAGLQAQVKYGDPEYDAPNLSRYADVLSFIPWRVTASDPEQRSRDEWADHIYSAHLEYGAGKSPEEARILFLAAIRMYPLFGAAQFDVIVEGGALSNDRMFLAVSAGGLKFVDHASRAILPARSYAYSQLLAVEVSPDKEVLALTLVDDIDDDNEERQRFLFMCLDAENIANLIGSYSPGHADWTQSKKSANTTANENRKKAAAAILELQQCNAEIAAARSNLSTNGYMLPPPAPKSILSSLSKRLSRRSSRAKSMAGNFEDDTAYPLEFWEFSQVPLTQPLLFIVNPESVDIAINSFNTLLVYAGILEQAVPEPDIAITAGLAGGGVVVQDPIAAAASAAAAAAVNDPNHVILVQNMISATLEKEDCCNEFYLQLIKQTTRSPPPAPIESSGGGSRSTATKDRSKESLMGAASLDPILSPKGVDVGLQNWRIFALTVGVVVPRHSGIVQLINAHIARHVADPNPEIAAAAQFVEQAYNRTLDNKNRKHPPSEVEILCRMKQLPIYVNMHLPGGESRVVPFDAASNTAETVGMLKEQLGLVDNTVGFSIFEVFGELERNMLPWEKLADAMFKWDRYSEHVEHTRNAAALASGKAAPKTEKQRLKLSYKRRLFLGPFTVPINPVEFQLTVNQAVDDVRCDRFPMTSDEATTLVALRAQLLQGDCKVKSGAEVVEYEANGAASGMYASVLKATCPADIAEQLHTAEIASQHRKLRGKTAEECSILFLNQIMDWPFYGATIFQVQQGFTHALPGKLWLGIDEYGIHALAHRTKKPLVSYSYRSIVNYSPSMKELKIIVSSPTSGPDGEKLEFGTRQASQIAHLIKDYTHIIIQQVQSGASPKGRRGSNGSQGEGGGSGGSSNKIVTPISKYNASGKESPSRSPGKSSSSPERGSFAASSRRKDASKPKTMMLESVPEPEEAVVQFRPKKAAAAGELEDKSNNRMSIFSQSINAALKPGGFKSVKLKKPTEETFFGSPERPAEGGGGGNEEVPSTSPNAADDAVSAAIMRGKKSAASSSAPSQGSKTSKRRSSDASAIAAQAIAAVAMQSKKKKTATEETFFDGGGGGGAAAGESEAEKKDAVLLEAAAAAARSLPPPTAAAANEAANIRARARAQRACCSCL